MKTYPVRWRGTVVGFLDDPVSDMWYLDGKWRSQPSHLTSEFEGRAGKLVARDVIANPSLGFGVELVVPGSDPLVAIVMSLECGRLFVRNVIANESVAWVRDNLM